MIQSNAKFRLSKLLQIGFNHDMAHGKVRAEDKLEERKAKKRDERIRLNKLKKQLRKKLTKSKKRQKHVENKEKRKKRASKAKKLAKEAEEKIKSTAIASKVDAAVQTSEVSTLPDSGSKDRSFATQTILNADVATHPTLPLPSTMVPKLKATPGTPEDDDDDGSDLGSVVSDVSSGTLEQEIESMKVKMAANPPLELDTPTEDYGIETSYWNPVVVVGLKVYSKESGVSIKVVRPHDRVTGEKSTVYELLASEVAKLKETATEVLSLMDDEEMGGVTETESDSESVTSSLSDF
jgi:hypothetical protein